MNGDDFRKSRHGTRRERQRGAFKGGGASVTLGALLEHRRQEIVQFLGWRLAVRNWTGPLCYITGLPRWLCRKIRSYPVETPGSERPIKHTLSLRDIVRIENACLQLGFRPTLPTSRKSRFVTPPPTRLPPASDPAVRIRFKLWQERNRINKGERKPRSCAPKKEKIGSPGPSAFSPLDVVQNAEPAAGSNTQLLGNQAA